MPISFSKNPGLIAYLTAGDPSLATTRDIALALIDNGADVLELGVPFSDPLADGPVIQRASQRAVANGTSLADVLSLAQHLRKLRPNCGLVLFSYLNPVIRFGQAHATFRDTIAATVEAEGKCIRQTSPISQYARIKIRVSPAPPGSGYNFSSDLADRTFPPSFIEATSKGVQEALREGAHILTDIHVTLLQAFQHDVDSSDQSFRIAGALALKQAVSQAQRIEIESTTGMQTFCKAAADSGLDGVLLTDMIVEEAADYLAHMHANQLAPVFLAAPTSPDTRLRAIAEASRGFVYAISRTGITGTQTDAPTDDAQTLVHRLRQFTAPKQLPIALGFGISTAEHVRAVGQFADAAVIGSAIVALIEQSTPTEAPAAVGRFLRSLRP